jgi:hypothetical protein
LKRSPQSATAAASALGSSAPTAVLSAVVVSDASPTIAVAGGSAPTSAIAVVGGSAPTSAIAVVGGSAPTSAIFAASPAISPQGPAGANIPAGGKAVGVLLIGSSAYTLATIQSNILLFGSATITAFAPAQTVNNNLFISYGSSGVVVDANWNLIGTGSPGPSANNSISTSVAVADPALDIATTLPVYPAGVSPVVAAAGVAKATGDLGSSPTGSAPSAVIAAGVVLASAPPNSSFLQFTEGPGGNGTSATASNTTKGSAVAAAAAAKQSSAGNEIHVNGAGWVGTLILYGMLMLL